MSTAHSWEDSAVTLRPTIGFTLSPRQLEVLTLLEKGHYLKEIGPRLSPPISVNTVKKHIGKIYRKLGASNGLEALWKLRVLDSKS